MKTKALYHLCALIGLVVAGTEGKSSRKNTRSIAEINKDFNKDLFYEVQKQYRGKSFSVTPGHILMTLATLLYFSKGATYDTLRDFFGAENVKDLKRKYKDRAEIIFDVNSGLLLNSSFKIYADEKYEFCPDFKQTYSKYFKGTTGYADFNNPKQAAKTINKWVNSKEVFQTGNKDLVDPRVIKKDGFIVAHTFTLQLDYDTGFNPKEVKQIYFYRNRKVKTLLPALYGTGIVKYASIKKYDAKFIDISLKGGNFTLFITLPNKVDGLKDLLNKIKNNNLRGEVSEVQEYKCVELTLPLGKLATQGDLTDSIKAIGNLGILFDKKRAEFVGVTKKCNPGPINAFLSEVYLVDKLIQDKNFNEMKKPDIAEDICPNKEKLIKIKIDHPFAFSIVNNAVKANPQPVIMAGIYN